jgi:hypothetical protein
MNYPQMLFAICAAGHESIGNALAAAVGYAGRGFVFGGEFGIGLRAIGSQSTTPVAWAAYSPARQSVADIVAEYSGDGPYPLLNGRGVTDQQVSAAKAVLAAECYPRETHEDALDSVLAAHGYELIPHGGA